MQPLHWPIESDWTPVTADAFTSPQFQSLQQFVSKERCRDAVYPPAEDVFNAFRLTSFQQTKVVILGQDPYHGPNQAHGLSFSVVGDCRLPPSLKNIFKELASDLELPRRTNGDLTDWATQGVLLLNTVLTVRAGQANSHRGRGWECFTDHVIQTMGQRDDRTTVFLLWGKPAEKKVSLISTRHVIITSPHPSPLSAHRGFFGSRPFSRVNKALNESGQSSIRWMK